MLGARVASVADRSDGCPTERVDAGVRSSSLRPCLLAVAIRGFAHRVRIVAHPELNRLHSRRSIKHWILAPANGKARKLSSRPVSTAFHTPVSAESCTPGDIITSGQRADHHHERRRRFSSTGRDLNRLRTLGQIHGNRDANQVEPG